MFRIDCGLLAEDEREKGYQLWEDEDFLYLLQQEEVVATFNAHATNLVEVYREIQNREQF